MDIDMSEDKGPMIITVCWVFTALAVLFVAARLHVRNVVHRKLFSDDYWIVVFIVCYRICRLRNSPFIDTARPADLHRQLLDLRRCIKYHGDLISHMGQW